MIKIICLGKIKEEYLKDAISDYLKRISKYHKIEIVELKDNSAIIDEEKQILNVIKDKDYLIALDINGEKVSSEKFAFTIDNAFQQRGTISFIIGSSNGLTNNILNKVHKKVSFGDITMPHGLFRAILLEQIYRAFKINNNESYHK